MLEEVLRALKAGEITQLELAGESGITQGTISQIVTGRTARPFHDTVLSLHAALKRIEARRAEAAETAQEVAG